MPVLLALVAVTAVWGVTFVQVKDAVALYPLFPFLALRFGIAAVTLALPGAARVRGVGRRRRVGGGARRRAARRRVRAADARARADERLERGLRDRDVRRAHAAARPRALPAAGRAARVARRRARDDRARADRGRSRRLVGRRPARARRRGGLLAADPADGAVRAALRPARLHAADDARRVRGALGRGDPDRSRCRTAGRCGARCS